MTMRMQVANEGSNFIMYTLLKLHFYSYDIFKKMFIKMKFLKKVLEDSCAWGESPNI